MIDDAHLLIAAQHAETALDETVERLRAGALVRDVQVRIEQHTRCASRVASVCDSTSV